MATHQRRTSVEPSVVVKNVDGRRVVSRTNPEISYAYGAPATAGAKSGAKKRRSTQDKDGSEHIEEALDDNAEASTSSMPDAKARYQALKKRKLQEAQHIPQSPSASRRSLRKGADGVESRQSNVVTTAGSGSNKAISSSAGGGVASDDLSSTARRNRLSSPGRSRSVLYGQLSSFYMDRDADSEDNAETDVRDGAVPSSILLGAQRQRHDLLGAAQPELDSIHSSDIHDSRSRDYAELQREVDLLEEADKSRQKGAGAVNGRNGRGQGKGKASGLNGIAEESDAEHSTEERKHTQKTAGQQTPSKRKAFPAPPQAAIRKAPVPIMRHSRRRFPSTSLILLAATGALAAFFFGTQNGGLSNLIPHSALPSITSIQDAALRKHIQLLEKRLGVAEKQVLDFEKRVTDTKIVADRVAEAANKLSVELSTQQRNSKSGQVKLDASVMKNLKQIFVEKGDDHVMSSSSSWAAFQKANAAALRKFVTDSVAQELKSGRVLDRSALTVLLSKEVDSLKAALEAQFNTNVQEMQNEILAKVRAQQDMYERAGSWQPQKAAKASDASLGESSIQSELVKSLIDDALETFASDRLGERDYALYSAGGRVIPSLTSATYGLQARSGSWFGWLKGAGPAIERVGAHGQPPVIALMPDNTPGMCWAFAGSEGQLGISLARRIIASKISLEHVASTISHEAGASAPRDVTVWAIVERPSDLKRLAAYRIARRAGDIDQEAVSPTPIPPSDRHLLLSSFSYDAFASRSIQTFGLSREAQDLQIPVAVVQVHVQSNHGKAQYTCLYRVRVHGREWTSEDEASS